MELRQLKDADKIYSALIDFQDIFPHLKDKVTNLDEYAGKLAAYAEVYVGQKEEKTFGILIFYANDRESKTAYISLIGVKKEYRYQKLGAFLLEQCMQISLQKGMKRLKLEVDLDNEVAMNFYKRKGFVIEEQASKESIYMQKLL